MGWMDNLRLTPNKEDDARRILGKMSKDHNAEYYNKLHGLPFGGIGDIYNGSDFQARQVGPDQYEVVIKDPMFARPHWGTSSGLTSHIHHSQSMVDGAMMARIINGEDLPQLGLRRISKEEREELKELEAEMKMWKKLEELKKFKLLPSHIRQAIVDEALIRDLMGSAEPLSQDFPSWDKLKELREKDRGIDRRYTMHAGDLDVSNHGFVLTYGPIIRKFKTEELIEAHSEASLEDELRD